MTPPARDLLGEAAVQSADPPAVQTLFAALGDSRPDALARVAGEDDLRAAVVAVAGASSALSRLLLAEPAALDVLADLGRRPAAPTVDDGPDGLARWKGLELLRLAARDLLGLDDLRATGVGLAQLGDDVLRTALALVGGAADERLVVVAMGKAGARELNYSSDIDVVFVGTPEATTGDARRVLEIGRRCFRLDADLRPEGRDGPLVRSLASFEAYWDRWASPWEFQALLKARPAAGPAALSAAFAEAAAARVWGRPFGAAELREVRDMKARSEAELARKGLTTRELKRGRGGIRDIEFAVQLLQMVHGRADERLRVTATLDALEELRDGGFVAPDDVAQLAAAYTFLRVVEHRLQLVELGQVHAVPTDPVARARLARTLGWRDDPDGTALARFDQELVRHQTVARSIHERLFYRPLLEAFSGIGPGGTLAPDTIAARLAALGFADADQTRRAVAELTGGLRRESRLLGSMLPLLLEWISEAPAPDLGLLGLRQLASGSHRAARLSEVFRESGEAARRLCLVLGTSRRLTQIAERQPEVLGWLGDDADLVPRTREQLTEAAFAAVGVRKLEDRTDALQRLRRIESFRIAAGLVVGALPADSVGGALTDLAEALVEAALSAAEPPMPMAVVAYGRLGGRELAFGSDLDVVLVHDEHGALASAEAEAAVGRFQRIMNGVTPARRVWEVDLALRPEGKAGRLATSLDALGPYLAGWAQTWERQAAVRARPCAGDPTVGRRHLAVLDDWVWGRPFGPEEAREVRRMKARVERERIPAGEDPAFHLKLGKGSLSDVEWTAQLLQLRHGVRATSTLDALEALADAGALSRADATTLADAWRFCDATRNRLYLTSTTSRDSLPTQADQLRHLAHSLGTTGTALRDAYRKVTRRARLVVERRFYEA